MSSKTAPHSYNNVHTLFNVSERELLYISGYVADA